jgi:hypothetical protein
LSYIDLSDLINLACGQYIIKCSFKGLCCPPSSSAIAASFSGKKPPTTTVPKCDDKPIY